MINAFKNPSLFRPIDRPISPANLKESSALPPSFSSGLDKSPLNKITLATFRRSSLGPSNPGPTTLIQDGSYMEMLTLKLSEAVSKALSQPPCPAAMCDQLGGKGPIPPGRGRALGALITAEFKATQDRPHLQRAILRSLQRPLSVLLTNLNANLLPLLSSPAFYSAPPTIQNPNPNATQAHALAIAGFVEELLEIFDALHLGADVDIRGDNSLRTIRGGFVSLINRVITPLVTAIHKELVPVLESLEASSTKLPGAKSSVAPHFSIITLQAGMPIYAKALAQYTTSPASQATLATFLISVIWRGLVALAHRPYFPSSLPGSSSPVPVATKKGRTCTTPPQTPPMSRFMMKLPPSRPPSPSMPANPYSAATDAKVFYDLLNLFPRPIGETEPTRLAQEAVDGAFAGLKALPQLLQAVHFIDASKVDSDAHLNELARELEVLATEVPLLIAIPVLLQAPTLKRSVSISVGGLIGLGGSEYRCQCLSGFSRAEECATTVASRVLIALQSNLDVHPVVPKWLELEIAESHTFSSY